MQRRGVGWLVGMRVKSVTDICIWQFGEIDAGRHGKWDLSTGWWEILVEVFARLRKADTPVPVQGRPSTAREGSDLLQADDKRGKLFLLMSFVAGLLVVYSSA